MEVKHIMEMNMGGEPPIEPFIIGVDPGRSLGIAVMSFPRIISVYQGEVDEGIRYLKTMLKLCTETDRANKEVVHVAIEKFIVTPGTGRRPGASQTSALVGRLTDVAESFSDTSVYLQAVSDASRFSNDLLRKLGLYVPASRVRQRDSNDANSAVRHILLCLARNRADLFTKLIGDIEL